MFNIKANIKITNNKSEFFAGTIIDLIKQRLNKTVNTGNGLIKVYKIGIIKRRFYTFKSVIYVIAISYTLFIFTFPLKIFFNKRFYLSGSYVAKNKLIDKFNNVINLFNIKRKGFFL